jgi:hypothetical protein
MNLKLLYSGIKNWLLLIFYLSSIGGGLFFISGILFEYSRKIDSSIWVPIYFAYFILGIIALIVNMKEVE